MEKYLSKISKTSPLTALFEVPSLRKLGGGRPLPAGRPALRSAGQSGEESRAGPQVTPVVPPLGSLPGLLGVHLHLTPRLPPQVQLQESPLFRSGHCVFNLYVFLVVFFPFMNYPKCSEFVLPALPSQRET